MFLRKTLNSETCQRNWLWFSSHTGKVYCFICKLTGSKSITTNFSSSGFCYWKHASVRVSEHESFKGHLEAIITLAQRGQKSGGIYHELAKHESEICVYWNQILQGVISTIKFIAGRGLAFRGDNEIVGSPHNGNYLGILELLSEYDTFLTAHIKMHANKGRGCTSSLSTTICEEIIDLMGSQVLKYIFCSIKKSKYFLVYVNSTPDQAHIDQLTIIVRYMDMEKLIPNERLLTFSPNTGHTGREMTEALLKYLDSNGISLHDCRGQSYDNAANMSGKYCGMQALIKEQNNLCIYVPCCAYSLNLVGKAAANTYSAAMKFFDFVQEVHVFFTASPSRYQILIEALSSSQEKTNKKKLLTSKGLSDTCWSCRHDAVKTLVVGYDKFKVALDKISINKEEKVFVCNAAALSSQANVQDRNCTIFIVLE
ncbi:uncharacterized protein LOC136075840 [Hydra vulgaris]|uniref:Uncharacterized protein LOC136075840 n=1 Tax=Hydra vulgaris TaxID=6087 RepID=A0ABM4B8Z4_HYDVU